MVPGAVGGPSLHLAEAGVQFFTMIFPAPLPEPKDNAKAATQEPEAPPAAPPPAAAPAHSDWSRVGIRYVPGQRLLFVLVTGWIVNFVAFVLIAAAIGGDALNGYAQHGRYFLRAHGHETEVSWAVFTYSKWHASITIAMHVLGVLLFALHALSGRSAATGGQD
jgi:hypothetical protein